MEGGCSCARSSVRQKVAYLCDAVGGTASSIAPPTGGTTSACVALGALGNSAAMLTVVEPTVLDSVSWVAGSGSGGRM